MLYLPFATAAWRVSFAPVCWLARRSRRAQVRAPPAPIPAERAPALARVHWPADPLPPGTGGQHPAHPAAALVAAAQTHLPGDPAPLAVGPTPPLLDGTAARGHLI